MRSDMPKVIIERGRIGGGIKTPKGYDKDFSNTSWEDQPKSEKIRLKWLKKVPDPEFNRNVKKFSEKLGPLYRWINSKVGQNWDDIYSEIRQNLSYDSVIQSHVMTHLYDYVTVNVIKINGVPCYGDGGYAYGLPIQGYRKPGFYVDPDTNILCQTKHERKNKMHREPVYWLNEKKLAQFKRIADLWYILELTKIDKNEKTVRYYTDYKTGQIKKSTINKFQWNDAYHNSLITAYQMVRSYGDELVCIRKKQANRKEIKQIKKILAG